MTTLLLMTDGRADCFAQTWNSLYRNLVGGIDNIVIHDDSGDSDYRRYLQAYENQYENLITIHSTGRKSGFSGAIRSAWSVIDDDYIIHWEDDFVLKKTVSADTLRNILDDNRTLAQIALKRQPWNQLEIQQGGIVECDPDAYTQHEGYFTHRKFFTTNPSMYRGSLMEEFEWPDEESSEGKFSLNLWKYGYYSGYLGNKFDSPIVTHIGEIRTGYGY